MPVKKKNKKKEVKKKLQVSDIPWAEQSADVREQTVRTLKTAFKDLELKGISIYEVKETQYPQAMSVEHLAAVGNCTEAQGKELQKFSNLMDVFEVFDVEPSNVVVGNKLPLLVTAFELDMKETLILEDSRGKIVFLQFWTTNNEQCLEAMTKLVEIGARKNAEWNEKVKLVSICCITTLEKLKAKLDEKKWTTAVGVHHLFSLRPEEPKEEDQELDDVVTKYDLNLLPECMIVDGEGRLVKRGDLKDFDVEDYIDRMLKGEKDVEQEYKTPSGTWGQINPEKRLELLESLTVTLKSSEFLQELVLVESECKITPVVGVPHTDWGIDLVGQIDVRGEMLVPGILAKFKEAGVEDMDYTVFVQSAVGPLTPLSACSKCTKTFLPADVRWHCAICSTPVTMCTDCMNKDSKSKERCDHPSYHYWYRIPSQASAVDIKAVVHGMGKFAVMMTEHDEKKHEEGFGDDDCNEVEHDGVFCNGCEGPITDMVRWKCASCEDFDFCDRCFQMHISQQPGKKEVKTKKGKKVTKEKKGHDQKHIFLRIEDSQMVQMVGEGDEGDEGDYDDDDIDPKYLKKGKYLDEFDENDTKGLIAKLRALKGTGSEPSDEEGHEVEKLNAMAEEAAQVPLPDDDF